MVSLADALAGDRILGADSRISGGISTSCRRGNKRSAMERRERHDFARFLPVSGFFPGFGNVRGP